VEGQPRRVAQDRQPASIESRRLEVGFDPCREIIVAEQPAQPAPVMLDSVVALVQTTDHQRNHLAIDTSKPRGPPHHRCVQVEMC